MTKKDLERRNKFLLLQLKIIAELTAKTGGLDRSELFKIFGKIEYHCDPDAIKSNLEYIEENDLDYNFLYETMNIDEYE